MYSAVLHDSITCAYIQFWLAIKKKQTKKQKKAFHAMAGRCYARLSGIVG